MDSLRRFDLFHELGTTPSLSGQGAPDVPRIFDEEGSKGWKRVCDAVHAKGGYICAQLWHT